MARLEDGFHSVRPLPFLDDLTTKNVLVDGGALAAIVDTDEICYGDRLLWVAQTRMALLGAGCVPDYAEYLLDALRATTAERELCDLYTGLCAFWFLSEQGMSFNRCERGVDGDRVQMLRHAVHTWLGPAA